MNYGARNESVTHHGRDLRLGIGLASVIAALAAALTGLLRPGDDPISASGISGGTASLLRNVLGRFGVPAHFVDPTHAETLRIALTPATRAIFIEPILAWTSRIFGHR